MRDLRFIVRGLARLTGKERGKNEHGYVEDECLLPESDGEGPAGAIHHMPPLIRDILTDRPSPIVGRQGHRSHGRSAAQGRGS